MLGCCGRWLADRKNACNITIGIPNEENEMHAIWDLITSGDAKVAAAKLALLTALIAAVVKLVEIGADYIKEVLSELRARERDTWNYLEKKLQEFHNNAELLWILQLLRDERASRPAQGTLEDYKYRNLPSFLEEIGIYLFTRRGTTRSAYRPFAEAVLLCDESLILWPDGERKKAFWIAFNDFAKATKRQGYFLNQGGEVKFDPRRKGSRSR
jgi:hypothetical protein